MPTQFCCQWKQPVLLQGSLQRPPKGAAATTGGGSLQPLTQLSAPHICPPATQTSPLPNKEAAKSSALSLEAATSRSATIVETPRVSPLGR